MHKVVRRMEGLGRQRREQRRAVHAQNAPRGGAGGQCPSTGATSPLHGHRH